MLKRILGLVILSFILSAYDPPFTRLEGNVIDENTLTPLDSAQIIINESIFTYTDNYGDFKTAHFRGNGSDFEILIKRQGYKPKYIDISGEKYDLANAIIKLQPTSKLYNSALSQNELRFINTLIKIVFSLFNLFTLIFILFKKNLHRRFLWVAGILVINPAFRFLYFDYSFIKYEILNGPFYLFNYWNYPYSLIIAIPLISMVFWILYQIRKEWIIKNINKETVVQE